MNWREFEPLRALESPRPSLGLVGWLLALCLAALGVGAAPVVAQSEGPQVRTPHVEARLVADVEALQPGARFTLGLHKRIIPGWHTYWRNPGDSGIATEIAWSTSPSIEIGALQWPAPERHTLGPVTNYGYADEVTLLTEMRVPDDAPIGQVLQIEATVDWLVCEEICIPEQVHLTLELPLAAELRGAGHPVIDAARERLPSAAPWPNHFDAAQGELLLSIDATHGPALPAQREVWFYPHEWGLVDHSGQQARIDLADGMLLRLPFGPAYGENLALLDGVLVFGAGADSQTQAYTLQATRELLSPQQLARLQNMASAEEGIAPAPAASAATTLRLPLAMLLALAGGLLLNLMPCVFPVLAMKVLSLLQHAQAGSVALRMSGLAYLAGVLASFVVLAGVVLALQAGGGLLGWGFQFQSPLFVVLVAWLLFGVGLNLSGVFSLGGGFAGVGQAWTTAPGYRGSFFTGVLAAVVATPCTAPFMGAAIGFAMTQPPFALLMTFLALGTGLALPFVVLAWWPALVARLPRPGAWMLRLKQGLAFPMYAAAIWLVWVLAQQRGADGVLLALAGMLALALAAWLYDTTWSAQGAWRRAGQLAAAGLVLGAVLGATRIERLAAPERAEPAAKASALPAQVFSSERLAELRQVGAPVFVNFTAAWCITCLVNERVALEQREVIEAFASGGVHYLKGDWTQRDAEIGAVLQSFGRSGVPLYLFYPAGGEAEVLPQILTPEIVLRALAGARPKT